MVDLIAYQHIRTRFKIIRVSPAGWGIFKSGSDYFVMGPKLALLSSQD